MSTRRFLAFTGIRSDYDLMSGVYAALMRDPATEVGLIVAGAHLTETYGRTVRHIEADGLPIIARIESLLDSNTPSSRLKGAAILLQGCIPFVEAYAPDALLFPGDREDVMVAALVGAYLEIPTVHFFGGDHAADGNVDNPVRHAASKLASLHFVTNDVHRARLARIGEPEHRIHVVGNPALDKFVETPRVARKELLRNLGWPDWPEFAVVIFHPILGEEAQAGEYFEEILEALKRRGLPAFVSYPNTDAGNRRIVEVIARYADDPGFVFYKNLDRADFVNLLRNCAVLVGNSSAGLLEAPTIPLGVVNVGLRQRGRLAAGNVVFVDQGVENITAGIDEVRGPAFQAKLAGVVSPYGRGDSVPRTLELLKRLPLRELVRKPEDPLT